MVNLVSRLLFHSFLIPSSPKCKTDDTFEFEFQGFSRDVYKLLDQLFSDLRSVPVESVISLTWIQKCVYTLRKVNTAFAKLFVEIDQPVTQMGDDSIEEYLDYSLNQLEFLNSISSSLSHLRHVILCSSHALTLLKGSPKKAADRLRGIRFRHLHKQLVFEECKQWKQGKEEVMRRALMIVRGIGYWVCGIVLSGLSGDSFPYLDMRRRLAAGGIDLAAMDDIVVKAVAGGNGFAKEMRDVDCVMGRVVAAVDCGGEVAAAAEEEMGKKLEEMGSVVDGVGKEVEGMFLEIMMGRNIAMDCLRRRSYYS